MSLGATYTVPLPESAGSFSVGATFVHTDRQIANEASPIGTLLLNLNANWAGAFGSPVDLAFIFTNVTDEVYPVGVGGSYASAGFEG